ncbi:MAG: hypothetical protein WA949_09095, partial [Phormidesmis sp.]
MRIFIGLTVRRSSSDYSLAIELDNSQRIAPKRQDLDKTNCLSQEANFLTIKTAAIANRSLIAPHIAVLNPYGKNAEPSQLFTAPFRVPYDRFLPLEISPTAES